MLFPRQHTHTHTETRSEPKRSLFQIDWSFHYANHHIVAHSVRHRPRMWYSNTLTPKLNS